MWRKVTARRRGVMTTPAKCVSCESSCEADWIDALRVVGLQLVLELLQLAATRAA